MSVEYEWQIHASCDGTYCNCYEITSTMGIREFKKYLKDKGWTISKSTCLCPDCTMLVRRNTNNES